MEQPNNNLAAAQRMRQKRVSDKTIANYKGKLNHIKLFLVHCNYGMWIENGEIRLPLPFNIIQELFGWLSKNTDLPSSNRKVQRNDPNENEESDNDEDNNAAAEVVDLFADNQQTISASCMQGYKSALLWWYAEQGESLNADDSQWIQDFVQGYVKIVADKKQRGVMKIQEGICTE